MRSGELQPNPRRLERKLQVRELAKAFSSRSSASSACPAADDTRADARVARVLNRDGTAGLQVWGSLESQPRVGSVHRRRREHAGPEAIDLLGSCWTLGDFGFVGELLEAAIREDAGLAKPIPERTQGPPSQAEKAFNAARAMGDRRGIRECAEHKTVVVALPVVGS